MNENKDTKLETTAGNVPQENINQVSMTYAKNKRERRPSFHAKVCVFTKMNKTHKSATGTIHYNNVGVD